MEFVLEDVETIDHKHALELRLGSSEHAWIVPEGTPLNPESKKLAILLDESKRRDKKVAKRMKIDGGKFRLELPKFKKASKDEIDDAIDGGFIKFVADGSKLNGEFSLIQSSRMRGKAWYLVNNNEPDDGNGSESDFDSDADSGSGSGFKISEIPEALAVDFLPESDIPKKAKPMHAADNRAIVDPSSWYFEPYVEGQRVMAYVDGDKVEIRSQQGRESRGDDEQIKDELKSLGHSVVFDGVITRTHDEQKRPSVKLVILDVLFGDGHNFREAPYQLRRKYIDSVLGKNLKSIEQIQALDIDNDRQTQGEIQALPADTDVFAKRKLGAYADGTRSLDWVRLGDTTQMQKQSAPEWKRNLGMLVAGSGIDALSRRNQQQKADSRSESSADTKGVVKNRSKDYYGSVYFDKDRDGIEDRKDTIFFDTDRDGISDSTDTYFIDSDRDGIQNRIDTSAFDADHNGVNDDIQRDQNAPAISYAVEAMSIDKITYEHQINREVDVARRGLNDDGGQLEYRVNETPEIRFEKPQFVLGELAAVTVETPEMFLPEFERSTFEPASPEQIEFRNKEFASTRFEGLENLAPVAAGLEYVENKFESRSFDRPEPNGPDNIEAKFEALKSEFKEFTERKFEGVDFEPRKFEGQDAHLHGGNELTSEIHGGENREMGLEPPEFPRPEFPYEYDESNAYRVGLPESLRYLPPGWGKDDPDSGLPRPEVDPALMPGGTELGPNDPRFLFHDARLQPMLHPKVEWHGIEGGRDMAQVEQSDVENYPVDGYPGGDLHSEITEELVGQNNIPEGELADVKDIRDLHIDQANIAPVIEMRDSHLFGPVALGLESIEASLGQPPSPFTDEIGLREHILNVRMSVDMARRGALNDVHKAFEKLGRNDTGDYVSDPHEFEAQRADLRQFAYEIDSRSDITMHHLAKMAAHIDETGHVPDKYVDEMTSDISAVKSEVAQLSQNHQRIEQIISGHRMTAGTEIELGLEPEFENTSEVL